MSRQYDYDWMIIARGEINQTEVVGPINNPRIVEYHSTTTLKATTDEVPWCSSFVNWVLNKAGLTTTRSAAARSWMRWGKESDLQYGAIVVLARGPRNEAGHVGFVVRSTKDRVFILGGNQQNAVNVKSFPKWRIISCRMPFDADQMKKPTV